MLDNTEKADYYAIQLTRNYLYTYDVVKTRYLRGDELLKAIQNNSSQFLDELNREKEYIINNNSFSVDYRIAYLEKMININLLFCDEDDFGFNVLSLIFDNIQLSKMILLTTEKNEKIIDCFNRIKKVINIYCILNLTILKIHY